MTTTYSRTSRSRHTWSPSPNKGGRTKGPGGRRTKGGRGLLSAFGRGRRSFSHSEQLGYTQYVDALKTAIDEAGFTVTEDPGTIVEGCGYVTFDFADVKEVAASGQVSIIFYKAPDADYMKRAVSWPVAGTTVAKANLPEGDYYVVACVGGGAGNVNNIVKCMDLGEDGWSYIGEDRRDTEAIKAAGKTVTVEAGKTLEIPNDTFGPVATEQLKEIEQTLAERAGA